VRSQVAASTQPETSSQQQHYGGGMIQGTMIPAP